MKHGKDCPLYNETYYNEVYADCTCKPTDADRLEKLMTNIRVGAFGGKHTPRQLLLDTLNCTDNMQILVVSYLDQKGFIQTGWSTGDLTKRIGMLEISKLQMIELAKEQEE